MQGRSETSPTCAVSRTVVQMFPRQAYIAMAPHS